MALDHATDHVGYSYTMPTIPQIKCDADKRLKVGMGVVANPDFGNDRPSMKQWASSASYLTRRSKSTP